MGQDTLDKIDIAHWYTAAVTKDVACIKQKHVSADQSLTENINISIVTTSIVLISAVLDLSHQLAHPDMMSIIIL